MQPSSMFARECNLGGGGYAKVAWECALLQSGLPNDQY